MKITAWRLREMIRDFQKSYGHIQKELWYEQPPMQQDNFSLEYKDGKWEFTREFTQQEIHDIMNGKPLKFLF